MHLNEEGNVRTLVLYVIWLMCFKVCLKPVKILKHKPFFSKSLISLFWHSPVDRTGLTYGLWCQMWHESAGIKLLLLSIFCLYCENFTLWCFHVSDRVITSLCALFGKDSYISVFFLLCILRSMGKAYWSITGNSTSN